MISKKELRKQILQKRDALTQQERREKSKAIAEQVTASWIFKHAETILLFASFRSEVDTAELFKAAIEGGKQVYYPKVIGKEMEFYQVESELDLEEGAWGIREPKAEKSKKFVFRADATICVILPGTVFDEAGNRIGYGGGYYDKFLQNLEEEWGRYEVSSADNRIPCSSGQRSPVYCAAVAFDCQIVEIGMIMQEVHDRKMDCIVTESSIFLCNAERTKVPQ